MRGITHRCRLIRSHVGHNLCGPVSTLWTGKNGNNAFIDRRSRQIRRSTKHRQCMSVGRGSETIGQLASTMTADVFVSRGRAQWFVRQQCRRRWLHRSQTAAVGRRDRRHAPTAPALAEIPRTLKPVQLLLRPAKRGGGSCWLTVGSQRAAH